MENGKPKAPVAGVIYGEIIYWGVLIGSVLVMIGSVLAFLGDNYVPVSYWLSSVWEGDSVDQIWKGATGSLPMGHWYFHHLTRGDALTALGVSLGVFSVAPALFFAGVILFKQKQNLYGSLAFICGCVVMSGVLGFAPMP